MSQADIGLIGLAVMGQNLVLNMADHGFSVAVYNRSFNKTEDFTQGAAANSSVIGCKSIEDLISCLDTPRKIMLMVKAGEVVDKMIEALLPHLNAGDVIIDGGNSLYLDTNRRCTYLREKGIQYIGTGVSGGEEGARFGPSIMPGGHTEAWPLVKDILQSISAKVDEEPCCQWVGEDGAGHFVKMVHNGIEYGDMQLISEAYQFMRYGLGMSVDEIQQVFEEWNHSELDSYLIEITANILKFKDENGEPLVDKILDTAGQKGTGKWTGINALELGVPLTLIGEAVFARCLSALKDERTKAASILTSQRSGYDGDPEVALSHLKDAVYAAKIVSYAQGYMLMREAAKEFNWDLNYGGIAMMWRGGCIIRSKFLGDIRQAYEDDVDLSNLMLSPFFTDALKQAEHGWRETAISSIALGISMPTITSGLSFYDGYRSERLPANILQAQRDYFGAHTYERIDKPRGEFFHTDWTGGIGAGVSSTTYEV